MPLSNQKIMLLHAIWNDLPKVLSTLAILISVGMILLSFLLYGIRNSELLRSQQLNMEPKGEHNAKD